MGDASYRFGIDLNNSLTTWKRTILKIHYSLDSQNFEWKLDFFPRQAVPKNLFALEFCYIGDTPNWGWIDFEQLLDHIKKNYF